MGNSWEHKVAQGPAKATWVGFKSGAKDLLDDLFAMTEAVHEFYFHLIHIITLEARVV